MRYYDPATGRYLTLGRGFDPYRPRTLNPYVPMQEPAPWLLAPVGVVAALLGRKRRKGGLWLWVLLVLVAGVGVSGVLYECTVMEQRFSGEGPEQPDSPRICGPFAG